VPAHKGSGKHDGLTVEFIYQKLCKDVWLEIRAYFCLRTCSLRRWWRILAGLFLWPSALGLLYLVGYNIYRCIKAYYWPPSWVKEPAFDWSSFLPVASIFMITVIAIVIGEKMGLFKRDASGRES
jgi:hypothetical protein